MTSQTKEWECDKATRKGKRLMGSNYKENTLAWGIGRCRWHFGRYFRCKLKV